MTFQATGVAWSAPQSVPGSNVFNSVQYIPTPYPTKFEPIGNSPIPQQSHFLSLEEFLQQSSQNVPIFSLGTIHKKSIASHESFVKNDFAKEILMKELSSIRMEIISQNIHGIQIHEMLGYMSGMLMTKTREIANKQKQIEEMKQRIIRMKEERELFVVDQRKFFDETTVPKIYDLLKDLSENDKKQQQSNEIIHPTLPIGIKPIQPNMNVNRIENSKNAQKTQTEQFTSGNG